MSATAYVGTEVDLAVRDSAAKVFDRTGVSLSEAIRLMISKTARDNCTPFDVDTALKEEFGDRIPNALTRQTIEKAERGEEIFHAKDAEDLFRQLGI